MRLRVWRRLQKFRATTPSFEPAKKVRSRLLQAGSGRSWHSDLIPEGRDRGERMDGSAIAPQATGAVFRNQIQRSRMKRFETKSDS